MSVCIAVYDTVTYPRRVDLDGDQVGVLAAKGVRHVGACKTCGSDAGILRSECADCERRRLDADAQRAQETRDVEIAALRERRAAWVSEEIAKLERRVGQGGKAALFARAYIPVDSIIDNKPISPAFDTEELRALLVEGWEIAGIVPRTLSVTLKNWSIGDEVGITAGGGLSGNVIGVYVLLTYLVTEANFAASRELIATQLSSDYADHAGRGEAAAGGLPVPGWDALGKRICPFCKGRVANDQNTHCNRCGKRLVRDGDGGAVAAP